MTPEDIPPEVFSGKPHRPSMGLRKLDMATWLDPDPTDPQLALRRELLKKQRTDVFAALPSSDDACRTVADAMARWVGTDLPGVDHPLVEAAQLVRDDMCVMGVRDGQWQLIAAVVCFPSRWRLADKMGRDVVTIHDPVPDYRSQLAAPTVKAFDSIAAHGPRWRVNATLLDDPALFQPVAAHARRRHLPGMDSYLRVERQCLVPVHDLIAFSIRTTVVPVSDLDPPQAQAVLASARSAPPEIAEYRGWVAPR